MADGNEENKVMDCDIDNTQTDQQTDCNIEPQENMADSNVNNSNTENHVTERQDSGYGLSLDTLPAEIFLHICSFLDAKFVIHTLSKVCETFHKLVMNDRFWKVRIAKRWPQKYPAIPVNDKEFDWKDACIRREQQFALWSKHEQRMETYQFKEGLFAAVDCVHFMKENGLLAVGSRDHYLNVLNLDKLVTGDESSISSARVFCKMEAHKGWIWTASSLDSILATGSWDRYIKFWDLAADGQEVSKVRCKSAVLCSHYEPGYFLAGGYDKKVYHIDPRTCAVLAEKRYHRAPVLDMKVDPNYILTASEDKTVVAYDRRADKVYKTLELEEYVMRMSYGSDQLWLADKGGLIHLVDATDGDFNLIETYDVGHTGKMTGIHHSLGSLITCSLDRSVKVLEPNLNPGAITTVNLPYTQPSVMDVRGDILAVGCTDASVRIWKPVDNL